MNVTLNPAYLLQKDEGLAHLSPRESIRDNIGGDEKFLSFIHPIHAKILSFFNGDDFDICVNNAANNLGVPSQSIKDFALDLLENKEKKALIFGNVELQFPSLTLLKSDIRRVNPYQAEEFDYIDLDLRMKRHGLPMDVTLMVTTKCATDCIYCYADLKRKIDCQIPLNRVKELIREARSLRMRTFDVIGGEFFLYKNWREVLRYLLEMGFDPYISTKIPISESIIRSLAALGISDIQISLDTLRTENLCYLLNVRPSYTEQIKKTLNLLDKYKIKTYIHTILTSVNDSIEDVESIYSFLKTLGNIYHWKLDRAGASLSKGVDQFIKIRVRDQNLDIINSYLETIKQVETPPFLIKSAGPSTDTNAPVVITSERKQEAFNERSVCSGNFSQLFILPDGNVTICEELYWNPNYIIGNVLTQGLQEIWTSEKARNLHFIPQSAIPAESACANCNDYKNCREFQGICFRDVIKSYGEDKWYYPDPRCPLAPAVAHEIA